VTVIPKCMNEDPSQPNQVSSMTSIAQATAALLSRCMNIDWAMRVEQKQEIDEFVGREVDF
jgi:hypothetical protein